MRGLTNRVAIVTGSTRGIGEATAWRLAAEGCRVVVTGRDAARGKAVATGIEESGGTAVWLPADLNIEADVQSLITQTIEVFGEIQILVNVAAPVDPGAASADNRCHLLDTQALDDLLTSGVHGVFWSCKYALPHLMKQDSASIVNVTTVLAELGRRDDACAYTMMRGAVSRLTMSLAYDYAPKVRANSLIVADARGTATLDYLLAQRGVSATLQRDSLTLGTVDDVAAAAAFLVSEESADTTGSSYFVDGGKAQPIESS